MVIVSARNFTISNKYKSFSAEMSQFKNCNLFEQVYPDACDAGFKMVNPLNGHMVTFIYADQFTVGPENEPEIGGWTFFPSPETIKKNPRMKGWEVTIFND